MAASNATVSSDEATSATVPDEAENAAIERETASDDASVTGDDWPTGGLVTDPRATDSLDTGAGHATDGRGTDSLASDDRASDGRVTRGHGTGGRATDGRGTDSLASDGSPTGGRATDGHGTDSLDTDSVASGGHATDGHGTGGRATDTRAADAQAHQPPDESPRRSAGPGANGHPAGTPVSNGAKPAATNGAAPSPGPSSNGDAPNEVDAAINALWREFRAGPNQRLRERLVLHYAPLVKYVAGRVGTGLPTHVDVGDLVQSGIFGLIDAIEKFDPERGWRFETYAMQRIRGAILDDLRSQDWVPRVVRSRLREAERALERLGARLHRTPTDTELADELDISLDELRDLYGQLRLTSVVALEDLVAAGKDSGSLVDTLPDDDAVDPVAVLVDRDNRRQLAEAIAQLTERDRIVVSLYYFESLTLAEIGKVLGVTESRVSQLHTRAVLRLRARLTS
jgi:RNA polymerase sigma factor for flagellar operon FliA